MLERSRRNPRRDQTNGREGWGREALHFSHGHLEASPKESQDRLFVARREQAKRQHRREKRDEKVKGFFIPLIVFVLIAGLLGVAGWRLWSSDRAAAARMDRGAKEETKKEFVQPAAEEPTTEVEKARARYLSHGSDSSESGN